MSYESKYRSGYVYLLCCSAALGGLMFGYSTSVITGAVHSIQRYYQLTPVEVGWAVSSIIIGCIAGSLAGGKIADRIGRKATLLLAALLFILSAAGSAWFASFTLFSLSRILCGLAVGLTGTASPMYMGEISPSAIRGKASGIYNLSVGLGQIIVFIVNFFIARGMAESWLINEGWRWMMAAQLVPAISMFLLLLFLPESPVWNVNRNNRNGKEKAAAVLRRIYPEFNAEHAGLLKADAAPGTKTNGTFSLLATSPVLKFALIVGCLIAVLQQCTGINVMMYYAPLVLQNGGGNTETVLFQTIFIALFNVIGGLIGIILFDRFGRMPIMKIGTLGAIIGLLITSFSLYTHNTGYITIFGILFFILLYAMSWGSGAWVLISEIFPLKIRAFGMGLAVSLLWLANFLITQFFPVLNDNLWLQRHFNGAFSMWLFVGLNILCFLFLQRFVPETKGIPLDDIEGVMARQIEKLHRPAEHPALNK
ncbi:sugar porter family MFS transporter [Sodalis sp. dw_96]|uniref:sugar porter family MFS transporter n=1 Tax=Sodalis sp. dw_96 TaxID=2719794 RepID=UPI001BD3D4E9|nr:sugar porter family MFS transporter [Sodalis sp. dw_96]